VREKKAKNEAAREQEASRRDQRDSAVGKTVEAKNGRSLEQWEAVYGDKDKAHVHTDSGVGTSLDGDPKKSASVAERKLGSIEMNDMGGVGAKHTSKGYQIRTGNDDDLQAERKNPQPPSNLDPEEERMWWDDYGSSRTKSNPATVRSVDHGSLNEMLLPDRTPMPGGPAVVPLPFSPSAERGDVKPLSEHSAEQKDIANPEKPVNERRGIALNQLAFEKLNQHAPANLPRIDDDRASSVAATADDARSIWRKSLAPTIPIQQGGLSLFADEFAADVPKSPRTPRTPIEDPMDDEDDEVLLRSPPLIVEPEGSTKPNTTDKRKRTLSTGSRARSTGSVGAARNDDNEAASKSDDAASVQPLKGQLPESISKVAMAYRTNEWAKHIADADQPTCEEAPDVEVDEAGVQVEVGRPVETPRPLNPAALSETTPPADPIVSSRPSFRQSSSTQQLKRNPSSGPTPVYAFSRSASQQSLQRHSSNNSITPQRRETRNVSTPILQQQTLLESPIEEDRAVSGPYQSTTPFVSTSNLLDERNTRLSRRTTSTSFNALAGTPNLNLQAPTPEPGMTPEPPTTASSTSDPSHIPGEENLTLAERKALIEQGTISPPPTRRQSYNPGAPTLGRVNSTNNPGLIYDSHQPRRTNTVDTVKQNAMLTQWRTSLQQGESAPRVAVAEEQARQAMLSQRERVGHSQRRASQRRETRESMRDVGMRTGQLTNKHQEAMRKMQAKANENTAPN